MATGACEWHVVCLYAGSVFVDKWQAPRPTALVRTLLLDSKKSKSPDAVLLWAHKVLSWPNAENRLFLALNTNPNIFPSAVQERVGVKLCWQLWESSKISEVTPFPRQRGWVAAPHGHSDQGHLWDSAEKPNSHKIALSLLRGMEHLGSCMYSQSFPSTKKMVFWEDMIYMCGERKVIFFSNFWTKSVQTSLKLS